MKSYFTVGLDIETADKVMKIKEENPKQSLSSILSDLITKAADEHFALVKEK